MKSIRKYRVVLLFIIDILIIAFSYIFTAFLTTENFMLFTNTYKNILANTIVISLIVYETIFGIFNIYKNITRYENGKDYIIYISLSMLSGIIVFLTGLLTRIPVLGYKKIGLATIITAVSIVAYRVIIRFILTTTMPEKTKTKTEKKNLLIIGGGEATREILKTLKTSMKGMYNVVGIIDDNPNKRNYVISGKKILGNRYKIIEACKEYNVDTIFFSITNIDNKNKKEILNICQETGAKIRILPSVEDIIRNKTLVQNLRNVEIEDVLGRDQIVLNNEAIGELIKDNTILVTGGGGSIGSELCRQIVKYNPKTH